MASTVVVVTTENSFVNIDDDDGDDDDVRTFLLIPLLIKPEGVISVKRKACDATLAGELECCDGTEEAEA